MGSKLTIFLLSVALVSLLLLGGCRGKAAGKSVSTTVDLTAPPPLPEETGAEKAPAAPTKTAPAPTKNLSPSNTAAPPQLPLIGGQ